ncbi:stimulated by retinoic acid gene 6 protein-like isoform X1 [Xenia sp. Carnegie-2017]|uniref:stimulated by retinoic acid gene 6 protein-like isoform X1 n=1 Tax=Xenia sp. Carnegie-2017 TaxID=2897299 RepID=UPI001F04E43D|nr:stimulated by retinoic acid gene 6 protein-like isoform X1 [Xenia sp. Carnegie-2017]
MANITTICFNLSTTNASILSNESTTSSTSDSCLLDDNYRHWFLIPAVAILTILAFLNRRKSFKTEMFKGRPGVVIPIDFLDRNRNTIVTLFGAITGSILLLVLKVFTSHDNPWAKAFLTILFCIEIAFLFYPIFGCLASHYRIIGSLLGFSYSLSLFLVGTIKDIEFYQKCANNYYLFLTVGDIPVILCQLFITGKFLIVLFKERKNFGQLFYDETKDNSINAKLSLPWFNDYVKNIFYPRQTPDHSKVLSYLRKIYNPHKYFKFSTHTLSVLMVCCIILYGTTIPVIIIVARFFNVSDQNSSLEDVIHGIRDSLIAALILTSLFCAISLLRFMENHKNNMLRMFKGDKSFITKGIKSSQFMIGKCLRYQSFQIGYFLWGYLLQWLMLFLICGFFYCLKFSIFRKRVLNPVKVASVFFAVGLLTKLTLPLTAVTIFRDPDYNKNIISMNNRNAYLVFSYFWFFIGLPMGILSALSRIFKAMIIGLILLPRVDHSVLPEGFQRLDPGYISYIAYLHVQATFRNPILRVFCQTIFDRKNGLRQWKCSPQARTRWFLALTLTRNPEIISYRKVKEKTLNDAVRTSSLKINFPSSDETNLVV